MGVCLCVCGKSAEKVHMGEHEFGCPVREEDKSSQCMLYLFILSEFFDDNTLIYLQFTKLFSLL